MSTLKALSKRERVDLALRGDDIDRVPVSAWRHFIPEERRPDTLAQASLEDFRTYDWDWLKLNPSAVYYAEAWGNRYDYERYDSVLPALIDGPVDASDEAEKIKRLSGTEGVFADQLELVRRVRAGIGDAHFLQTIFSPLSVLGILVARPDRPTIQSTVQAQYDGVHHFIRENPQGAHVALQNIAATLGDYAAAVVEAGASGLFFAIVKLAREEVLTLQEYQEFGEPYDRQVLAAVQGAPFNLLHTCGPKVYFDLAIDYPVHALNWATLNQDNPTVGDARRRTDKALIGGVDELGVLQNGSPEEVRRQAWAAIGATDGHGFLLAPGCGTHADVPPANLHALRQSAEVLTVA